MTKSIPKSICEDFYKIFDIYPTNSSYKEVMKIYNGLEMYYEDKNKPVPETNEELFHYCNSTISKYFNEKGISLKYKDSLQPVVID